MVNYTIILQMKAYNLWFYSFEYVGWNGRFMCCRRWVC